jgi:hypothetical protein
VKISDFIERIPESQGESRTLIGAVAEAIEAFRRKADGVRSDKDLTSIGHRKKLTEIANGPRAYLQQLRDILAKDRAELRERRESLVLPRPDDSAAAEHRRAELRAWLARQSPAEALRAILADTRFAEAALDAPRQLSGLDEQMYARIHQNALDTVHGAEFAALADEDAAHQEVASALNIAGQLIDAEIEMNKAYKRDEKGDLIFGADGKPVVTINQGD